MLDWLIFDKGYCLGLYKYTLKSKNSMVLNKMLTGQIKGHYNVLSAIMWYHKKIKFDHLNYPLPDYPLGTMGTVPRAYDNEESITWKEVFCSIYVIFNLPVYKTKTDKNNTYGQ